MALSDDLRKRVVEAVVEGGLSRNAAAKHFKVSIASAVRWVKRYETTGKISPSGGDRRSGRVEAQRGYLLGLIRCGASSIGTGITFKKVRPCERAAAPGRAESAFGAVCLPTRS